RAAERPQARYRSAEVQGLAVAGLQVPLVGEDAEIDRERAAAQAAAVVRGDLSLVHDRVVWVGNVPFTDRAVAAADRNSRTDCQGIRRAVPIRLVDPQEVAAARPQE